jgi:hypothetical protein
MKNKVLQVVFKEIGGVAQVVDCLLSKREALSSTSVLQTKKKTKQKT